MYRYGGSEFRMVMGPPGAGPGQGSEVDSLRSWITAHSSLGTGFIGEDLAGIVSVTSVTGGQHLLDPISIGKLAIIVNRRRSPRPAEGEVSWSRWAERLTGVTTVNDTETPPNSYVVPDVARYQLVTWMRRRYPTGNWDTIWAGLAFAFEPYQDVRQDYIVFYAVEFSALLASFKLNERSVPTVSERSFPAEAPIERYRRYLRLAGYFTDTGPDRVFTSAALPSRNNRLRSVLPRNLIDESPAFASLSNNVIADTARGQTALQGLRDLSNSLVYADGDPFWVFMHHGTFERLTQRTARVTGAVDPGIGFGISATIQTDWGGVLSIRALDSTSADPTVHAIKPAHNIVFTRKRSRDNNPVRWSGNTWQIPHVSVKQRHDGLKTENQLEMQRLGGDLTVYEKLVGNIA